MSRSRDWDLKKKLLSWSLSRLLASPRPAMRTPSPGGPRTGDTELLDSGGRGSFLRNGPADGAGGRHVDSAAPEPGSSNGNADSGGVGGRELSAAYQQHRLEKLTARHRTRRVLRVTFFALTAICLGAVLPLQLCRRVLSGGAHVSAGSADLHAVFARRRRWPASPLLHSSHSPPPPSSLLHPLQTLLLKGQTCRSRPSPRLGRPGASPLLAAPSPRNPLLCAAAACCATCRSFRRPQVPSSPPSSHFPGPHGADFGPAHGL